MRGDDGGRDLADDVFYRFSPACAGTTIGAANNAGEAARFSPACAGTTDAKTRSSAYSAGSAPRARGRRWPRSTTRGPLTVQPRVRGDDGGNRTTILNYNGSAPRARGRRERGGDSLPLQRFSPACAGTTKSGMAFKADLRGSAPRARGRLVSGQPHRGRLRFSPACAGTTPRSPRASTRATVQPRVRGDDVGGCRGDDARERFSPACAGTTTSTPWPSNRAIGSAPRARGRRWRISTCPTKTAVQPRVRGDDDTTRVGAGVLAGSAPRARGRRGDREPHGRHGRFSPACAGTTIRQRVADDVELRFSPACAGTTGAGGGVSAEADGSAPRARGRRGPDLGAGPREPVQPRVRGDDARRGDADGGGDRFSPACAGTTLYIQLNVTGRCGSAPRARGRLTRRPAPFAHARFSPACAGTTPPPGRGS